ncbi:MAG: PH domain-containing protein [Actinomycetota bacterium]|nr:PH domain-containing protein [Actinomycetota bacterium]
MDEAQLAEARGPVCRFGPDRRLTLLCGVLAVVGAVSTVLSQDPAGRILLAVSALILAAYTVTDLVFWPRLVASAAGLQVRAPGLRGSFAWTDVESVRADVRQRLGLRSTALEIDVRDCLVVFSRRALGADPAAVAGVLRAFNPG